MYLGGVGNNQTSSGPQVQKDKDPKKRSKNAASKRSTLHVEPIPDLSELPGLNKHLLAKLHAAFGARVERLKDEDKIPQDLVVTWERLKAMVNIILNLLGEKGQENFRDCLCSKSKSSASTDTLRPLKEDIENLRGASPTNKGCVRAAQTTSKSNMSQAEAFGLNCRANMMFTEYYDSHQKLLKQSSSSDEHEELDRYWEPKGRRTGQGVGYDTLFIHYLLEHLDPSFASLNAVEKEKKKVKFFNDCSHGRLLSAMYRQFGPGIFCYITSKTQSLLKSLKGEARVKVLDAFLEASAVTIPNLQEIFDYSQEAMEGNSSITLEPVTALRKLIPLIRQDSENSVKLIAGTEILNEEFEHCGRPDDASALLNEFGAQSQTSSNSQKTQSDSGYDYNDHDDDNDDNHDDSNDNDNDGYGSYNNDADKENDEPGTPPAKRQKLGQLPVHTRR